MSLVPSPLDQRDPVVTPDTPSVLVGPSLPVRRHDDEFITISQITQTSKVFSFSDTWIPVTLKENVPTKAGRCRAAARRYAPCARAKTSARVAKIWVNPGPLPVPYRGPKRAACS